MQSHAFERVVVDQGKDCYRALGRRPGRRRIGRPHRLSSVAARGAAALRAVNCSTSLYIPDSPGKVGSDQSSEPGKVGSNQSSAPANTDSQLAQLAADDGLDELIDQHGGAPMRHGPGLSPFSHKILF